MPKSFTDQQRDQILKKLLSNGKKLFSRFGLQKTTVDEIARIVAFLKALFIFFQIQRGAFL
jgi:AcrR family transcriptional regulator